jgi:hypothetical protein
MRPTYLIGAALGLVAAVAFASATTGPMLVRLLLMFITPLPIALAGLGWGWVAAVVASAAGTALIFVFSSPAVAAAFAITQAAPMVFLTYLALLSRPIAESGLASVDGDDATAVEWYPVGRLVIWSAALAGLMAIAMLMIIGGDLDTLRKSLGEFVKATFESGLAQTGEKSQFSEAEIAAISEIALSVLPAASAISWMGSLLFNLWLAGRVTHASGQLGRPWPDLAALTYPAGTPLVFGIMLLATMIAGYPGLAAAAFSGGLFLAYLLLGLAILHYTTRGQPWRPFALWLLYGTLLVVNIWIAIVIAMLGLAETVLHLRARSAAAPRPPSQPNT